MGVRYVRHSVSPALGYMEIVCARDAAMLIQQHVQPDTVIWSDSWAAYNGVSPGIQNHSTVNHSIEFTTPAGVHTNHKFEAKKNAKMPQIPTAFIFIMGGKMTKF